MEDVIIIGGGPAGMTAGIYAARKGLKTLILESDFAGGQMAKTTIIENYPGFAEPVSGIELSKQMEEQAKKVGVRFEFLPALRIETKNKQFCIRTDKGCYDTKTVIIATGAKYRKLQVPGEEKLSSRGVSYCVTCDGPLFKNRAVGIVGGGNAAATAALYLKDIASKIYLFHRRDELRADKTLADRVKKSSVKIMWDTIVKEVKGDKKLEEVVLYNKKTKKDTILKLDGLFIAIGETPTAKLAEELGVKTDQKGFVLIDRNTKTNVPGVFACGDVTNGVLQIATAIGEGATAGLSAYSYIQNLK